MLLPFRKRIYCNIIADTRTLLKIKTLHAMIYNPYIEKPVLLDDYSNTDYNKKQYEEYFREATQFAELIHLVVTAMVIVSQPAQMAGAIIYANTLKPIMVIPCTVHQVNLIFTHSIKEYPQLHQYVNSISNFVVCLRKKEFSSQLGSLCPLQVKRNQK